LDRHPVAHGLAVRRPRFRAVLVVMALPAVRALVRHAVEERVLPLPAVDAAVEVARN
jgi:hypothetical protein